MSFFDGIVFLVDSSVEVDKDVLTKHGGEIRSRISAAVTHIISHAASTLKSIKTANGKIIITSEWIDECIKQQKLVSTENYFVIFEQESQRGLKRKEPVPEVEVSQKKLVKQIRKGMAVVDPSCPAAQSCHVFDEGNVVWDATLNQTNIGQNNNKFYLIQLLKHDSTSEFYVWRRWGRVGANGQSSLESGLSLDQAKRSFTQKFKDKTGNSWDQLDNFEHRQGKYDLLQRDYGDVEEEEEEEMPVSKVQTESKLDGRVQKLMSLIFDTNMMKQSMVEIGYDAQKLPLGKLTKSHFQKGYDILKQIAAVINGESDDDLKYLSSRFYTVIPHDFGRNVPPVIDKAYMLKTKLEMMDSLAEIRIATSLIGHANSLTSNPTDAYYQSLKTEIVGLDRKSLDWSIISEYVASTHAATHTGYTLELVDLFTITRQGEDERFKPFEGHQRMLLWHGSRLSNFVGILSQGLRIAPPEAPVTGYMFGKGIYFADMVTKSANYCNASRHMTTALLLLSDVAVGMYREFMRSDYSADRVVKEEKFDSTKGVGASYPSTQKRVNFCENAMSEAADGSVIVPCGPPATNEKRGDLMYNEFIVYNTEQVRLRYLVRVQFNFKK